MKYNKEFKEKAIKEVLNKKENQSMLEISEGLNISKATLYKWVNSKKKEQSTDGKLSSKDKLQMLYETYPMSEEEVNAYCRKKGIFKHQIKEFETAFLNNKASEEKDVKNALAEEKSRNKTLEKELRRKEKALAETATLLVLQKKFQALLEDGEV